MSVFIKNQEIFFLIYFIFIYFLAVLHLHCCARAFSICSERGYCSLQCTGFSLRWLLFLRSTGSRCMGFSSCGTWALEHAGFSSCGTQVSSYGSQALECRLSSCGARAQLLRGMWDLPGPGIEPVAPALAGRVLTTVPPGKSQEIFI